jgi:insulysin
MEAASDLGWNTNEPIHPKKSVNDNREYLITKLNNGLRLLMIADPTAEKSACAISVRVGSLADPDSSLGLAHFL